MTENEWIEEIALTGIDMLANDINQHCADLSENYCGDTHCVACLANALYSKGYRKVERGEWKRIEINGKHYGQVYYQHSDCPINQTQMFPSPYNSCPNCGADMRGEKDAEIH